MTQDERIQALEAEKAKLERMLQDAVNAATASERFRMEDAHSHINDLVFQMKRADAAASQLTALRQQLEQLQAENKALQERIDSLNDPDAKWREQEQ